ncbi:MAG: membrane protein insertase YidC [Candidatus Obscuribacterales bacterium]|nr:membrane protein insertase YidC [Candidatus Obscuribacterales bacterium]
MDISYLFMLPILLFLDKTLGSYGWAILGLTLAVRILVWPLVSASTKSMQTMSKMQPKLKALQDKYKDQPEELQRKMAEFYMKNKINPLGGCLPMLVQLPILFALFGTFTGPPFQDKAIPVKVKLVAADKSNNTTVTLSPTSSADSAYVGKDGKLCKFVVHPGDSTLIFGKKEGQSTADGFNTVDFSVSASQGEMPADFKPRWTIASDPLGATINPEGQANFPTEGEITIGAVFPPTEAGEAEKSIPVKVKVLKKGGEGGLPFGGSSEDAIKEKKEVSETSIELNIDGKPVKLAVEPGDLTILAGKGASFHLRAIEGSLPASFQPVWKVIDDPNGSSIDENGKAVFKHPGEVVVNAMIPGEAKNEPFLFISNIGKGVKGMDLFKPENFDVLSLILLFGVTMWLSQKVMVTTPPSDPEQAAVQKQTQQIMPFTVTGMFFFMPLPAGVYLYMVFSNVVQTLQTWLIMKSPSPELPDIDDDNQDDDKKGKKGKSAPDASKAVIDVTPNDKKGKKAQESGDSAEKPVKLEHKDMNKEGKN